MAFRKRYRKSRRTHMRRRGRRFARRTRRIPSSGTLRNVHYFKRTHFEALNLDDTGGHLDAVTGNWTYRFANGNTLDNTTGYFSLDQLPGYTEFTALYDQYKICGIGIRLIYNRNSANAAIGAGDYTGLPILHMVRDWDDGTPLTNLSDMREYGTYKAVRLNQHKKFIKVGIDSVIASGAVTDTTRSVKAPWLDCSFVDVKHFGWKWCIELPGVSAAPESIPFGQLQCFFTYYVAFRNPR